MKIVDIWSGLKTLKVKEDKVDGKMSSLNWKDFFNNNIIPMHIQHNLTCNIAD